MTAVKNISFLFGRSIILNDIRQVLKTLITSDDIQSRICELSEQISLDFKNKSVTLICVLKGSIFFAVDLAKKLDLIFDMEFIEISSYGNGRQSSGDIIVTKDLKNPLPNKHFIIVEDIIDTGCSLNFLINHLKKFNPLSISTCVLLDKPDRRKINIKPDYAGFVIDDKFIVGYGLDYCDHFRNINYVGYLED